LGDFDIDEKKEPMNNINFYNNNYSRISLRDIQWRELSGNIKAKNIIDIVGEKRISTVLDIGAGTGAILSYLNKVNFASQYYALDISDQAIAIIKSRSDLPNLVEAGTFDGSHISYSDQQFDLGILSHVIEHLINPTELLLETGRVAKYVVIEVPLEDNLYTHMKVNLFKSRYREEIGHVQWFNYRNFSKLLRETCGFSILAMKMVYMPDDLYYFYKGSYTKFTNRLSLSAKKILRSVAPALYTRLLTDHCIALVSNTIPLRFQID
jgi:ubiquinone/menaquinone biosynthesis C-methylase UbiE